jgi:AraC-like DNA-binding protein
MRQYVRTSARGRPADIPRVGYRPPGDYDLDIELFPLASIRERVAPDTLRVPRRLEFHLLIYVATACTHDVDFEALRCPAGSVLTLRPGQVHSFGSSLAATGWMVPFVPEFLQPSSAASPRELARQLTEQQAELAELPTLLSLRAAEAAALEEALRRMREDARAEGSSKRMRHALLRYQLLAVLQRLQLAHARDQLEQPVTATTMQRFRRFRDAVEREFRRRHQVAQYTRLIGCSTKSLVRAVQEAAGVSAKAFLSQRIALEAKRLLVHTDLQVAEIADELGFDEATNFVKFFRREAGASPGAFRKQHAPR